jgi:hypothetical protein
MSKAMFAVLSENQGRITDVALFAAHLCQSAPDVAVEIRQMVTHALKTGVLTVPENSTVEDVVWTVAWMATDAHRSGVIPAGCVAYQQREAKRKRSEA